MSAYPSVSPRRVTIVGGGYSGATTAVQLVRASALPLAITIVEPRAEVGGGLAHSADDPDHRLNGAPELHVVDPADPGGFQRWCTEQRIAESDPGAIAPDGTLYVRRKDFGAFVADTVRVHAAWSTGSTIHHLRDLATDASAGAGTIEVRTANGHVLTSDMLVLATGNTPPRLPAEFDAVLNANPAVVAVPTDLERVRAIHRTARVLVLGSGLTALDILSTLIRSGHEGAITVISRRGLRPRPNRPKEALPSGSVAGNPMDSIEAPVSPFILAAGDPPTTRSLLRALRRRIREVEAAGHTWYAAFDDVRDVLWQVWPGLSLAEKRRFMKRLRPWWDAHRFRAPPQNEAMVREAERDGRIKFRAARLRAVTQQADGQIRVDLLDRDTRSQQVVHFDAVVNCTGLDAAAGMRDNPFLAALQRAGLICADGVGLGFAVDGACRAIGSDGHARHALRVVGPPTAGTFGDPFGALFIAAQIRRAMPSMLATLGAPDQPRRPERVGSQPMQDDYILETQGLVKEFKGFIAVDGVDLRVRRGSIHALIGPNGAGKTTFFNLLTKFLIPTRGRILFNGQDITKERSAQVARRGIVRSFQISATFPHLSVLDNVRIGLQRATGGSFHFWKSDRSLDALNERALELLETVGLASFADWVTAELPYGRKRALELATTLAIDPELMLLDEPTQGMGHEDVERVTELIRKVAADRTVLMVEHNMSVVESIADTISVLQRGKVIAEGPYATVSKNPQVLEAYMGHSAEALAEHA